jgi:Protein of unknown function (DUF3592)
VTVAVTIYSEQVCLQEEKMNVPSARLRWRYLRGVLWWIGVAFAFLGTVALVVAFFARQYEKRFQSEGVPGVATVTGKDKKLETTNKKRETHYYLLYAFRDAAGKAYQGRERVSQDAWQRAKNGDTLAIQYVRDDPATNRPAKDAAAAAWGPVVAAGFGGLFAITGWSLAVYAFIRSGRRVRIVRDGVPALGVVDDLLIDESAGKVNGIPFYCLTYRFTDEEGSTHEGRSPALPRALQSRWQAGDPILILYDRENSARSEADIFEARADDLTQLQDQGGDEAE